ncbi:MAG: hypothetical protein ABJB16_02435, partial [Saprospiraceae bacterium]
LSNYVLPITDQTADQKLADAHTAAWPIDTLGTPPNYVSFNYYKALGSVNTSASHFIQQSLRILNSVNKSSRQALSKATNL